MYNRYIVHIHYGHGCWASRRESVWQTSCQTLSNGSARLANDLKGANSRLPNGYQVACEVGRRLANAWQCLPNVIKRCTALGSTGQRLPNEISHLTGAIECAECVPAIAFVCRTAARFVARRRPHPCDPRSAHYNARFPVQGTL